MSRRRVCLCRCCDSESTEDLVQSDTFKPPGITDADLLDEEDTNELSGDESSRSAASPTKSQGSAGPAFPSPNEKTALQEMVKQFAREAVEGFAVSLVHPSTADRSSATFSMDRHLTTITLSDVAEPAAAPVTQMKTTQISSVYRGDAPNNRLGKVPLKKNEVTKVVGLEVTESPSDSSSTLIFYLDDSKDRDKFYVSLLVLSKGSW